MNVKSVSLILFLLCLLSYNVSADVDLVIQSDNEQVVKVSTIDGTQVNTNGTTNNTITMPYDNYVIKLYPDSTKLNNGTVMGNIRSIVNNRYTFIWLGIFVAFVFVAFKIVKGK